MREAKKIQVIMNKCASMILGRNIRTRTRILMSECNWLYFSELVTFHSLTAMWKLQHHSLPYHLRQKFRQTEDNKLITTPGRILTSRMSFRWRAAREWSELPQTLREEDNLRLFKSNLKKNLIENRPPIRDRDRQYWD